MLASHLNAEEPFPNGIRTSWRPFHFGGKKHLGAVTLKIGLVSPGEGLLPFEVTYQILAKSSPHFGMVSYLGWIFTYENGPSQKQYGIVDA